MTKIYTARDARAQKQAHNDEVNARIDAAEAAQKSVFEIINANPQIGVLNNGMFYVFPVGGEYREADHPSKLLDDQLDDFNYVGSRHHY